ncbi:hypothetical protein GQ457_03G027840 [Hibiscus cannabinus]
MIFIGGTGNIIHPFNNFTGPDNLPGNVNVLPQNLFGAGNLVGNVNVLPQNLLGAGVPLGNFAGFNGYPTLNPLNFRGTGGNIHGVPNIVDPGFLVTGFGNLAEGPANQNGLNFGGPGGGLHSAQNILDPTGFGNLAEGPTNLNALIPCEKGAMVAGEDEHR